jgi:hypothetical protein
MKVAVTVALMGETRVDESACDWVDKMVVEKEECMVVSMVGHMVEWKADDSAMMRVDKKDARMVYKWVGAMDVLKAERMAPQLDMKMVVMMVDPMV